MKRYLQVAVFLALCVLVAFILMRHTTGQLEKTSLPGQETPAADSPQLQPKPTGVVKTTQQPNPATAVKTALWTNAVGATDAVSAVNQQALNDWQVPIDFYGEVVDQSNNPVAGANINFNWTETPQEAMNEGAGETASTSSDEKGLFELHGKHGPSLDVRISKPGYYTSKKDSWTFSYAINGHFTADPVNPVIFHLRAKGTPEPLMRLAGTVIGPRQYRLDVNGVPTDISFYTGKRMPPGRGQFEVEYRADPPQNGQRQFGWHCRISVPGGGLQPTTEEFPFSAPAQGYQETVEIDSNMNAWADSFEGCYYCVLSDGKCGLIRFTLTCGGNPFFGVEVLVNPSGSTNLEYEKYLPGNMMVDQSAP
jgi:hypothetical protein